MRLLLAPLVALILAAPACGQSVDTRGLTRLRIPEPGVELHYRLEPGTALTGHLRLGQTRSIDGLDQPLSQAVECDVTLVVGTTPEFGAVRLAASFTNVDLAWGLPPASTFTSDEFRERALETLRSYRGWIEIDERGGVVALSPPPDRTPEEIAELLQTLLDTLDASFVPIPDGAVERGESWDEPIQRPPLHGTMHATLEGLFQHKERDEPVALLEVDYEEEHETPTDSGSERQGRTGEARVLYSTEGGYVAEIDRELSRFAPSRGMTYEKLRVKWSVLRGLPPPVERITDDVQVISDPCNPDYVGPKPCEDPTATTAPDPEAAEEADAGGEEAATDDGGTEDADEPAADDDAAVDDAATNDADEAEPKNPPTATAPATKPSATKTPATKPPATKPPAG